jgi:hypothetical protein
MESWTGLPLEWVATSITWLAWNVCERIPETWLARVNLHRVHEASYSSHARSSQIHCRSENIRQWRRVTQRWRNERNRSTGVVAYLSYSLCKISPSPHFAHARAVSCEISPIVQKAVSIKRENQFYRNVQPFIFKCKAHMNNITLFFTPCKL